MRCGDNFWFGKVQLQKEPAGQSVLRSLESFAVGFEKREIDYIKCSVN
jgi:hypothetical protein